MGHGKRCCCPRALKGGWSESIFDQFGPGVPRDRRNAGGRPHTEVTYDLPRPIVAGAMLGEVEKDRVVLTSGARPGDTIVLTKGIAVEGTAILAREAAESLRKPACRKRRC